MARTPAPKTTRLSSDVTKPQPTAPGDAPADTYDPLEQAHSAPADKAAAAAAGHQTVNAVIEGDGYVFPTDVVAGGTRSETYEQVGPDGTVLYVTHNYDTGVTTTSTTPPAP